MSEISTCPVPIKAYSKKQLCAMYGISLPTLRKWIEKSCKNELLAHGYDIFDHILKPEHVKIIFKHLGEP